MANSKQAKFIVDVSAESKHTRKSSVRFFSYDSKTAEIVIQAEKDNELIPRGTISNVEIYFESVNSSYRPTESLKWNDQMTINDDGLFLYTLTDDLLNYQGLVAFEVYINYINNDKSDSSNRIIYEQRTSAIDRAADEIEIVYIKDMETAKKEVADKAAEVKESLAGYDSGLDIYADQKKTEMDDFTRNVQETAINEIAMIQNELPKVKQVNVDETKKIKAEYPIVEQVATTEKEKIRAVLSTVDQTASEVSAYADRKISEYDAKFTQSNQKMNDLQQSQTELSNQLDETKKKVDAADVYRKDEVFNKPESSANVIYQVIGKEKAEITFRLDAKSEFVKVSSVGYTTLLSPTNVSWTPLTEEQLNNLSSLDGSLYSARDVAANYMKQLKYDCDILGFFKSLLGEKFFTIRGATTDSQKVEVLESLITDFTSNVYGYGSGGGINKLTHRNWNGTWTVSDSTAANEVTRIGQTIESTDTNWKKLINGGKISVLSNSEPTISPNYSTVNIDYLCLDVTIELSANEHFEYMIAAYCRPLEQQLNDLAQKVAAMENK